MRRNLIVPTLFAIIAVGGLVCPVTGQEFSGDPIWQSGVGDRVMAVALSPDGLYGAVTTEKMVYLYSQNGTTLWSYPVSGGRSVAVSSGGERIAAGGDHLLLFDRNGSMIWRHRSGSRVQDIAITADGRTICTGADTGLQVFSLDNGETTPDVSGSFDANDPIRSVSIDSDGAGIIAGADSGNVYFLGADGRFLWNYRTGDNGIHVAISRDGSTIAAASTGRAVYLLNPERAASLEVFDARGSRRRYPETDRDLCWRTGHLHAQPGRRDHRDMRREEGRIRSVSAPSDTAHILAGATDGTYRCSGVQPETLRRQPPPEPSRPSAAPAQEQTTSQQDTALPRQRRSS